MKKWNWIFEVSSDNILLSHGVWSDNILLSHEVWLIELFWIGLWIDEHFIISWSLTDRIVLLTFTKFHFASES